MAKTSEVIQIGQFELTTQEMIVSDPCYEPGTWCMGELKNCIPGTWNAAIRMADEGEWGHRVAILAVWKDGAKVPAMGRLRKGMRKMPYGFRPLYADIGVDSGQAGFFDKTHYRRNDSVDMSTVTYDFSDWDEPSDFYKACCDRTLNSSQAGTIPFGAISSSGYGDGCYCCCYHENLDRKVDMAFISFL